MWGILGLNVAVVNWVFLTMQMSYVDRMHYKKNERMTRKRKSLDHRAKKKTTDLHEIEEEVPGLPNPYLDAEEKEERAR